MKTPPDERGLLSRLPDDDAYWEALTDRLVRDAAPRLAAIRAADRTWWRGLSRLSTPLAFTAAAAVAAALLWLPEADRGASAGLPDPDVFALVPAGSLAERLVRSPAPPDLAALIAAPTPEASR
jgi:hypothetical protein